MTGARLRPALPALLLLIAAVGMAWSSHDLGDYTAGISDDNARPVIDALAHGHFGTARHVLPAMGLVSILLRVPFAALGGHDAWLSYRLGVLACLLPLVALAVVLDRRAERAGADTRSRVLLGAALLLGPGVLLSVRWGHPEQVLVGVFCVAAVLAAIDQRVVLAGVLLGLALGTKQDAIVATIPVLLTVGGAGLITRDRITTALWAGGVALLFNVPIMLLDWHHYQEAAHSLARRKRGYPQSAWWPLDDKIVAHINIGPGPLLAVPEPRVPWGLNRAIATGLAMPIAVLTLLIPAVRRRKVEPLALLTALLALRVAIDPMNIAYYFAGAMLALIVWETTRAPGELPMISFVMSLVSVVVWYEATHLGTTGQFLFWAVGTLPFFLLAFVPKAGLSAFHVPGTGPNRSRPAVHEPAR